MVSRLRMLRSDIWRRAATGGMRDSMEGRRVTSAFMSLSSSSSWFKTMEEGYRRGDAVTQVAPLGLIYRGVLLHSPGSRHQGALLTGPEMPPGRRMGFPKELLLGACGLQK